MPYRQGPGVVLSCLMCEFHEMERYRVQGDSGYDHSCKKLGIALKEIPGDCHPDPKCPFIVSALTAALEKAK